MIYFIITLISLLLGYYLGTKRNPKQDIEQINNKTQKEIAKLTGGELKAGVIKRPSAQDLWLQNEDPKKKEAKDAIREGIEQNPELVLAQQRADDLKQRGLL